MILGRSISARRRRYSVFIRVLMYVSTAVTSALVLFLVGYVLYNGAANLSWQLVSTKPSYLSGTIGILPDILNTVYIVVATLLLVLPLGVGAANGVCITGAGAGTTGAGALGAVSNGGRSKSSASTVTGLTGADGAAAGETGAAIFVSAALPPANSSSGLLILSDFLRKKPPVGFFLMTRSSPSSGMSMAASGESNRVWLVCLASVFWASWWT